MVTPGVHLIIIICSSFLSIFLMFDFMEKMFRRIQERRAIYLIIFILMGIIFTILNLKPTGYLNLLFTLIYPVLVGHFLYGAMHKNEIGSILFLVAFLLITELLGNIMTAAFFTGTFSTMPGNIYRDILCFLAYKTLMHFYFLRRPFHRTHSQSLLYLILPLLTVTLLLYLIVMIVYTQNQLLITSSPLICLILLFFNLLFYSLLDKAAQLQERLQREAVLVNEMKLQYQHYQELSDQQQSYRKIVHDFKNHIAVLDGMLKNQSDLNAVDYQRYKDTLLKPFAALEHKSYSTRTVLNLILQNKKAKAENAGIVFHCSCEETVLNQIQDFDLTTLLANLLDNAIEACCKNNYADNQITFILCRQNELDVLHISNTCPAPPAVRKDRFISSKQGDHGIGLENVRDIIEKYQGHLLTEYKNQEFLAQITIPASSSQKL